MGNLSDQQWKASINKLRYNHVMAYYSAVKIVFSKNAWVKGETLMYIPQAKKREYKTAYTSSIQKNPVMMEMLGVHTVQYCSH